MEAANGHPAGEEATLPVAGHFTLLVYPFQHALTGPERGARLPPLAPRWQPWWARLDRALLADALDSTYYFLPYIRLLLFPETALLPSGAASGQVDAALTLAALPVDQLAARLTPDGVLRLTYDPRSLAALQPLRLQFAREAEHFDAALQVSWIDVVLFPQRIGFLILRVQIDETAVTVARLTDLLALLRPIHPPKVGWTLAQWNHTGDGPPFRLESRDLVDYLLQGLTADMQPLDPHPAAFLARMQATARTERYSETDVGEIYGQAFHQFSYACLAGDAPSAPPTGATSLFASLVQQALFELATGSHSTDPDTAPDPRGLRPLLEQAQIAFWSNWEGLALQDNVVFLGVRPSPFTLRALPVNVEGDYFYLYLLTLYQKIRLSLLVGETVRRGANLHRNLQEARLLTDRFMMFRNHYWFSEVTPKAQGNALYARFQQALGVQTLFQTLRESMTALQTYYEDKDQRRIRAILNFGGFVGLPTLILSQLYTSGLVAKELYGLVAVVLYTTAVLVWVIWSRRGGA